MKIEIIITTDAGRTIRLDSDTLHNPGLDALSVDQAREIRRIARALDDRFTTDPARPALPLRVDYEQTFDGKPTEA